MEFTNNVNKNCLKTEIKTEDMIQYLQEEWTIAFNMLNKRGADDTLAHMRMSWCIGMKEMCEALIGQPVNLQRDGIVRIGY